MEQIVTIASQMRKALEGITRNIPDMPSSEWWLKFPNGCCGNSSNLLAAYLADHGFHSFEYVRGHFKKSGGPDHAWLEGEGLLIDITGDQFSDRVTDGLPPIFVSRSSDWHKNYFVDQERQGNADFRTHKTLYLPLSAMYSKLQPFLRYE